MLHLIGTIITIIICFYAIVIFLALFGEIIAWGIGLGVFALIYIILDMEYDLQSTLGLTDPNSFSWIVIGFLGLAAFSAWCMYTEDEESPEEMEERFRMEKIERAIYEDSPEYEEKLNAFINSHDIEYPVSKD